MADNDQPRRITDIQVLGPDRNHELMMPPETPLGLGILGAARFAAIRRVFEHWERALRAVALALDAEAEVGHAMVRRETAREQLRNVDLICRDERNRIQIQHDTRLDLEEVARLERRLQKIELTERIAAAETRMRPTVTVSAVPPSPDSFAQFLDAIGKMPSLAAAAASVKAEILARSHGEVSDADATIVDTVDAMVQSYATKQAEGALL